MDSGIHPNRYCVHQVTLLEQCDFRAGVEALARAGIGKTVVWRDKLDAIGVATGRKLLDDNGVEAVALAAGGLFCRRDEAAFRAALDANRHWLEQAAALGAASLVVITGGLEDFGRDLTGARSRALDALGELADEAAAIGVGLVLEPLHPMLCGNRSVVSTLGEANDCLDALDRDDALALALDTYATWWDAELDAQIARAGARIRHFHVSDWLADTRDVRLDRGMPGDGLIDNRAIRRVLEATGFDGPVEIEIFSARNWWRKPPDEVLATIVERYRTVL